jgi:sporulation protein YhbH
LSLKIHQDHSRFKEIVRGKIKANLRKYVQKGEMLGKKGKDVISIPIPFIDIPHFKYGHKEQGGVGQGEGEIGQQLSPGAVQPQDGAGQAGQGEGEHALEVDVSLEELAQILGEELQLPNIERRGREKIVTTKIKYTGINTTGPESLRHFKRTYKQALKRQIALGKYDPAKPIIIPTREDRRYRSYKLENLPETNAVIIYMMDVSGSMGDEQKEIVRIESFWLDTWLRHQYKGLEARYIIHDAVAREVDRETFFHTRESGGTMISSAYKLCKEIIKADYPSSTWNIYPFHFSDGDNWSADDTRHCVDMLKAEILPAVNQFAYGQVESPYGSGQFIKDLRETIGDAGNVALSEIADKDAIYQSIKDFLGKGR